MIRYAIIDANGKEHEVSKAEYDRVSAKTNAWRSTWRMMVLVEAAELSRLRAELAEAQAEIAKLNKERNADR